MQYVYRCPDCGSERVITHAMTADPLVVCSECGGHMRRRPQNVKVNWGGLKPSQGDIHPNIRQLIDDAPRRRDGG